MPRSLIRGEPLIRGLIEPLPINSGADGLQPPGWVLLGEGPIIMDSGSGRGGREPSLRWYGWSSTGIMCGVGVALRAVWVTLRRISVPLLCVGVCLM